MNYLLFYNVFYKLEKLMLRTIGFSTTICTYTIGVMYRVIGNNIFWLIKIIFEAVELNA